jgi:hypothetical protein
MMNIEVNESKTDGMSVKTENRLITCTLDSQELRSSMGALSSIAAPSAVTASS